MGENVRYSVEQNQAPTIATWVKKIKSMPGVRQPAGAVYVSPEGKITREESGLRDDVEFRYRAVGFAAVWVDTTATPKQFESSPKFKVVMTKRILRDLMGVEDLPDYDWRNLQIIPQNTVQFMQKIEGEKGISIQITPLVGDVAETIKRGVSTNQTRVRTVAI